MKTRKPTTSEKKFMDDISKIGCIVCRKMGYENDYVSLHHIDGRVRKECHYHVIPLCERHHQIPDTEKPKRWKTLHFNKKEFESEYGTENELYLECLDLLGD